MTGFEKIEGSVIIQRFGIYKACDLYTLDTHLFAKAGAVYYRLLTGNNTSSEWRIYKILTPNKYHIDNLGRLCLSQSSE